MSSQNSDHNMENWINCFISSVFREMQITTTMRYDYIKIKKTNHFNCSKDRNSVNNRNLDTMLVGVYKTGIIALGN